MTGAPNMKGDECPEDVKNVLTAEQVNMVCKQVLDETVGNSNYSHSECGNLNQATVENITKRLVDLNLPFKFIVTSSLLQIANGSGLNVSTISYWNKGTDCSFQHRWETRHILAVVNVFAVAI